MLPLAGDTFPDISDIFLFFFFKQKTAYEMFGVSAANAADQRKWLRHAAWPEDLFPLRKSFDGGAVFANGDDGYPFVQVGGEGVHEIPVGPVHAGTIEPGHFRFSLVGEGALPFEERLCYQHKSIAKPLH